MLSTFDPISGTCPDTRLPLLQDIAARGWSKRHWHYNHSRCTKADVRRLRVPLAPLNEQKRIADKLDAVLARVDACRERLDRVPAILKRFRQAVLAAATSGKLTEEWREANPKALMQRSWLHSTHCT